MRIGVTGYSGMIGQELLKYPDAIPLAGDVRNPKDMKLAVRNTKPSVIVHLASLSDVDECQKPENKNLVINTNVRGTYNVAEAGLDYNIPVVLLSSSQVFDGIWGNYNEKSNPHPKNFYGMSKWGAESLQNAFPNLKVVRTSYVFDYERMVRHIYPLRMKESYEYPTFMQRSFIFLPHFVCALYEYLHRIEDMPSILHISGSDTVSWYRFMKDVARAYGLDERLICERKRELPDYTPRPYKAGLNVVLSRKLGLSQYSYLDGLREMAL